MRARVVWFLNKNNSITGLAGRQGRRFGVAGVC